MRLFSVLIVVFALVIAGVVGVFVVPKLMTRSADQAQQAPPPKLPAKDVLVAAHNLPAGTILKADDLSLQRWPEEALNPNFMVKDKGADPQKDAVGRVVLRGFEGGEAIVAARLLKPGEAGFLAAALKPGMRAVSMKIDPVTGAAGLIVPGDRVDILLSEHYSIEYASAGGESSGGMRPKEKNVDSVMLYDVRVLAIDQQVQDIDSKPKLGTTATVEVDLEQAQKLALAARMGILSLALRSHAKSDTPDPDVSLVQDVEVSPFLAGLTRPKAKSAGSDAESGGGDGGVRVYHGAATGGAGK